MSAQIIAVLSGDLKKSTALDPSTLDFVRGELAAAVDAAVAERPEVVAGGLEFFRGDAWQLALHDPAWALRIAVMLRARLKERARADTRIAIGIGAVDRLHERRVSLSTGDAFTRSGLALDAMKSAGPGLALDYAGVDATLRGWVLAALDLCDAVIDAWTPAQAQHVGLALANPGLTQRELGRLCTPPIAQETMSISLARANWRAVERAIAAFDATDWAGAARS